MEKLSSILLLSTLLLAPTYAQQELFQENQDEDELDRRRDYVEALETGFGRLDPGCLSLWINTAAASWRPDVMGKLTESLIR